MTVTFRADRQRWRYDFVHARKRFQGYCLEEDGNPCTSRRAAEKAEAKVRMAAEAAHRAPAPMPSASYTLAEALAAYVGRADKTKSYWTNQKAYVAELLSYFGGETALSSITEARVWEYIAWSRQQPVRVYMAGPVAKADTRRKNTWKTTAKLRSDNTTNKHLTCLRKTMKIAHATRDALRRRLLADVPDIPELKIPKRLPRPIGDTDIGKLMRTASPHTADAILLSLLLGLRRGEAYAVTRHQVDFENGGVWLKAEQTKAGRGEFMVANSAAMTLLRRLVDQSVERGVAELVSWRPRGKGADGGPKPWQPIANGKRAIRGALKRAGLEGLHRFHDLKASFTTALAHVAPGRVVKELARHKSWSTTEMYVRVAEQATRDAVEAVAGRPALDGVDLSLPMGEVTPKSTPKPVVVARKRRNRAA